MARLTGKVAVVTGAAHGIGAAIARRFVAEGSSVVLADVAESGLARLASELDHSAVAQRCDVSVSTDVEKVVRRAESAFGGVDIVVNNAAAGSDLGLLDLRQADWEKVLAVGLGGLFHMFRHAVPAMRERGGGAFVNLSSVAARRAMRGMAAYAAAKAGVEAVTRCAAWELRSDGIRVNAIAPGMIRTFAATESEPVLSHALGTPVAGYIAERQGRWGEPDEVAEVAVHLASDEAAFTSGQTYVLDNGASDLP